MMTERTDRLIRLLDTLAKLQENERTYVDDEVRRTLQAIIKELQIS